jgi:NAD(P)-dependent dehydrogenase (short-subunit alcohol dehydrogenase family)
MDIRDRVCLVTGGAQGIGQATAEALARRGGRVVVADVQLEKAQRVAASLAVPGMAVHLDVTDNESIQAAVAQVAEQLGDIAILVNNAGIGEGHLIEHLDEEVWQRTLDVNLTGPFRMVQATLPQLKRTGGHVVTVASLAARIWAPLLGHYNATKAGVAALNETLRIELKPYDIGVTTVYFGTIDTPLLSHGMADPQVAGVRDVLGRLQRLGVSPLVSSHDAAEAIVRGIEQDKAAVVKPRRGFPLYWVNMPFQRLLGKACANIPRSAAERRRSGERSADEVGAVR